MTYAAITGWGKCLPPAILTNKDLATFIDTDDEWIVSRTGMQERRISHVGGSDLGYVAAARALAVAGKDACNNYWAQPTPLVWISIPPVLAVCMV
jgi:3-oxoacyl-[acyl-carrier-protein] synthase-3